jgi:hypothetical protein
MHFSSHLVSPVSQPSLAQAQGFAVLRDRGQSDTCETKATVFQDASRRFARQRADTSPARALLSRLFMKRLFFLLASSMLLVTHSALADESSPSASVPANTPVDAMTDKGLPWTSAPAVRISGSMIGAYGGYERTSQSPQSESGLAIGGELRVHPYSANGAMVAFTTGGGIFGPTLTVIDTGYSLRAFAPRLLTGVTAALYFDLGPSLGFVTAPNGFHHDVGGRAGVALDLEIWNATLGVQAVYHGGLPVDGGATSQWESSYSLGFRAGFAFDVGRKPSAAQRSSASRSIPADPSM